MSFRLLSRIFWRARGTGGVMYDPPESFSSLVSGVGRCFSPRRELGLVVRVNRPPPTNGFGTRPCVISPLNGVRFEGVKVFKRPPRKPTDLQWFRELATLDPPVDGRLCTMELGFDVGNRQEFGIHGYDPCPISGWETARQGN